jgi:hypothetical protein
MVGYGLTPKGQMDPRWRRPDPPKPMNEWERRRAEEASAGDRSRSSSSRFRTIIGDEPWNPKDRYRTIEREHSGSEDLPGGGGDG